MKIQEAVQFHKGSPFIIDDCGRDNLPQFFVDQGYKKGAEIGTHKGEFAKKICEVGLELCVIDPWMGFDGQGRSQKEQEVQDGYYDEALKVLSPFDNCTIIRKTSMDALNIFKDGSLDFVYLDGNHDFRHAAEDIFEWSKKVRSGGVVSGHDYFNTASFAKNVVCNVGVILDAYVKAFDIKNWYIFKPNNATNPNDKVYSWMFIKD